MTNQEIRIEVAKEMGWTLEDTGQGKCWHKDGIQAEVAAPDYDKSLDACQEFMLSMPDERVNFNFELIIIKEKKKCYFHELTALDWCIAFLETKKYGKEKRY